MNRWIVRWLAVIVFLTFAKVCMGNGYGDYPPRLAWSPSGDLLMASLDDSLVIWEEDSGIETVVRAETSSPAFSPDGSLAVFILDGGIFVLDPRHPSDCRRLPQVDVATACTFDPLSASGEYLICYTTMFLGSQLYVISVRNSGVVGLLPDDTDARVSSPVVSPDGRNIACTNFAINPTWYDELYLIGDAAPLGRRARSSDTFGKSTEWHESNPVWLSDSLLVFQIGGWGDWELRYLDIYSGQDSLLLENAHQAGAALHGRLLCFCRKDPFPRADWGGVWEDPTTVWVMDRETGYMTQASEPGDWAVEPAVSQDGEYIAWIIRTREGDSLSIHEIQEFVDLHR